MDRDFEITAHRVDLVQRRIRPERVTVRAGRIARVDRVSHAEGYLIPGFVDAHVHIESSMLLPSEFARAAVIHGTVAAVCDPHEIANVCGLKGVELMLRNAATSPFQFCFGAPSCVPATEYETSGARIDLPDVERLLDDERIGYLSEVMNFPGVIAGQPEVLDKLAAAHKRGLPIDGHAPGLRGDELVRYLRNGISTDHETVSLEEGLEKIALGCNVAIREGSAAKNFDALWPLLQRHAESCMFCSDDKHPDELVEGHINQLVARSVARGCDVLDVLCVACLNPVRHYRIPVGTLQLGDSADFVLLDDLQDFQPTATYIGGVKVAARGQTLLPPSPSQVVNQFATGPITTDDLRVPAHSGRLRVIDVLDGQLVTGGFEHEAVCRGGCTVVQPGHDILKLVVINRYQAAPPSLGFARGFGLSHGALASSVAHDSHNVVAVGVEDHHLAAAINAVIAARGGLAVAAGDAVDILPLPVAGLMSPDAYDQVASTYSRLDRLAKALGSPLRAPWMTLSFLCLLVIPALKLSDRGLFDVDRFEFTSLFNDGKKTSVK